MFQSPEPHIFLAYTNKYITIPKSGNQDSDVLEFVPKINIKWPTSKISEIASAGQGCDQGGVEKKKS